MSSKHPQRKRRLPRLRIRRRTKPGAVPGTITVDPGAPKPTVHVISYGREGLQEERLEGFDRLPALLAEQPVTWVHVEGLGDAAVITRLGELFDLHPLALEDVVNVHQRPKVEEYPDHLFVVARLPARGGSPAEPEGPLETEQISFFLGSNFVLSFRERPGESLNAVLERLRRSRGSIRRRGPDYLLYALLDSIVDSYFPVVEGIGSRLEAVEEQLTAEEAEPELMAAVRAIRADLLLLRKTVWWTRDAVNLLIRDRHPLIAEETRLYLRDCYDHTVQLIDISETYREMTTDLRDYYLSKLSARTNDVMKVLTIIATIFIPLGFIAGLYGMNFATNASPWNMPELGWQYGYPFALGLMLVVALAMLVFFWRRGWIGK